MDFSPKIPGEKYDSTYPQGMIRAMQTHSGKAVDVFRMGVNQIEIVDIAHGLSLTCRYGGHCRIFYSVAQHSIIVADNMPKPYGIFGLMHDAAEAYLGDVIRPLKQHMRMYRILESQVLGIICKKFDLPASWSDKIMRSVTAMDNRALFTECLDIMGGEKFDWGFKKKYRKRFSEKIIERPWQDVKHEFLLKYKDYMEEWQKHET